MKKELWEIVDDELKKTGNRICKQICKYNDQYIKDREKELITGENKSYDNLYEKHCLKCPIIGWFH